MKVDFYLNKIKFGEASVCKNKFSGNIFLYNVEVFDKHRGKGLSHIIVEYMINYYLVSELYVKKDNFVAIKLYKKHGFYITQSIAETHYVMRRNCAIQKRLENIILDE